MSHGTIRKVLNGHIYSYRLYIHPLPKHKGELPRDRESKKSLAESYFSKGYNQIQIAAILGVDNATVSGWFKKQDWRKRNPEKRLDQIRRARLRPHVKVNRSIRRRLKKVLDSGRNSRLGPFNEMVGCTPHELVEWIETLWEPGMSWDNYGTMWQIDHVTPVSKLKDVSANHFSNLQPLWSEENNKKSNF